MLIREQVRGELARRIDRAELPPGGRINEVALAAELGVSRTPLKEALLAIERDGYLRPVPGRGFHVAELDPDELRQAAPILAALEALALRTSSVTPDLIARLRLVNLAFAAELDSHELRALDEEFHATMIGTCGNPRLLALINRQTRVLRRYHAVYEARVFRRERSARDHAVLIDALDNGARDEACALLDVQWREQTEALAAALDSGR